MYWSVRSVQRDRLHAAALTLFATTRSRYTGSSVCVSACSKVARNCIALRLGQTSSFFIACAGSNNKKCAIAGNSDQSTLKYDVQSRADENKRGDPMTMAVDGSQN